MDKMNIRRIGIILILAGFVPMIISKVVACIMIHDIILPIQESMSELARQYQSVSREAMNVATDQSIQNYLRDTGLQFNSYGIAFVVLFVHVVSTMICSIVGRVVCEGPLRDWCIDELSELCSEEDMETSDIAESILVGITTFLLVCLMLYSKLSAFL